jgi:hypothetical protein
MNRNLRIKELPCLACEIEGRGLQCGPTESHHLNLAGLAGQKRRGDEFTINLGAWHHRAARLPGMTSDQMSHIYGPSLALNSKLFRFTYGQDDFLLALTNLKLQAVA